MTATKPRQVEQPSLLDLLAGRPESQPSRWLLGHLVATGHLTESGLSRRARIRPCPKCKALILAGLDDDECAFEVAVDPVPLNPLGEALATIERRRTYRLRSEGGRYVLDPRGASNITRRPAGSTPRADVLRTHRCGTEVPEALATATSFSEARPALPPNARPDF